MSETAARCRARHLTTIMATAFYSHPDCLLHDMGEWHPECPARLTAIQDQLIASRIDDLIEHVSPPLVEESALLRVHTQAHLDYLKSVSPKEGLVDIDGDTLMNLSLIHISEPTRR